MIRTARRLGIATVAVYSDADRDALHVREADEALHIGPVTPRANPLHRHRSDPQGHPQVRRRCRPSGLRIPVAKTRLFAEALAKEGVAFIGPPVNAIQAMGDKITSKEARSPRRASPPCPAIWA